MRLVAFQLRLPEGIASMVRAESRRHCMRPTAWLFQAAVAALESAGHNPSSAMPDRSADGFEPFDAIGSR